MSLPQRAVPPRALCGPGGPGVPVLLLPGPAKTESPGLPAAAQAYGAPQVQVSDVLFFNFYLVLIFVFNC